MTYYIACAHAEHLEVVGYEVVLSTTRNAADFFDIVTFQVIQLKAKIVLCVPGL